MVFSSHLKTEQAGKAMERYVGQLHDIWPGFGQVGIF